MQRKVNNNKNGNWYCERFDNNFLECDYKYILKCKVQDHTAFTWITIFLEAVEEIMGVIVKELYILKN